MQALRIAFDTTVTELTLPDLDARRVIREHLGSTGAADQAVYHRRALKVSVRWRSLEFAHPQLHDLVP
ncbi:hypothetical protein O1M63_07395 [Streptomyces mirabilis]|nr:hypothetical protein [Streptomyces mirabilis]